MTGPRYLVGMSPGYCVYDRRTGTFGERLTNKRVAVREVKRLNAPERAAGAGGRV